jgi:hypothetical protein
MYRRAVIPLLAVAFAAPAFAQDPDDLEIDRLRQEAEDALGGADAQAELSLEERLRRSAELEAEDDGPLDTQLLEAFGSIANRLNAFNPRITVFGDFLGRVSAGTAELVETDDNGDEFNLDDRASLREVELDLRADIDPYAKGVFILALEEEFGEYHATVEEGYVVFEALPFGFRAKVGRFRVPFGRINRLHTHDLPQATRPYSLTDMLGEEGYVENGGILSWLTPWIPLELFGAFLNGENESLLAGAGSDDPAWLGRAEYFQQLGDTAFISFGASYLFGYNDAPTPAGARGAPDQETHLRGADILFKWQPTQFESVVAQAEFFSLRKETGGGNREYGFGGYGQLQVQPFQNWYGGVRYDWSNYDEGQEDTEQWAVGAWVSYYTTEFLRVRVGYEHRERASTNGGEPDLDTLYFQLTFVFGSHPVEPFWFNR